MKKLFFILFSFAALNFVAQTEIHTTINNNAEPRIERSFRPVFTIGAVGSQIDGDTYSGYAHLGAILGVGINRQLSPKVEVEFMLTFIQKGVRSNYKTDSASLNNPNNPFSLIRLNYLEIPVYFRFTLLKKLKIELGGAFGYLIKNPPYNRDQYGPVPDAYNKNWKHFDGSFLAGLGYQINQKWFVDIRWEYSLVPVSPYPTPTGGVYRGPAGGSFNPVFGKIFNKGLYNNCLMLTLSYKLPYKANSSAITPNAE